MEKQFVTYEIASQLKQLGFNEPCFGFYNKAKEFHYAQATSPDSRIIVHWCKSDQFQFAENGCIAAPLWQQAIDFFYQHHIYISILREAIGSDEWEYVFKIDYLPGEFKNVKRRGIHFQEINSIQFYPGGYYGAWNCPIKTTENAIIEAIKLYENNK